MKKHLRVAQARRDIRREARVLLAHPWGWIASGFGGGFSPWAPGTVGSAVALGLFAFSGALTWPWWLHLAIVTTAFAIGVLASDWTCRALATDDASAIVMDEWVGQWLTLAAGAAFWPIASESMLAAFYACGFVLFRIADILKPWPANLADRSLHGGFGAMFDDLLAAVYSALALAFIGWAIA